MNIVARNRPTISLGTLGIAGACAVLAIALFAVTAPKVHAFGHNFGGDSYNNNSGSHNGNGGGFPNSGGNNNGSGNNWGSNNGGNGNGRNNNNNGGGQNNNTGGPDSHWLDHRITQPPFQNYHYPVPSFPHFDHPHYQPPVIQPVTYYQPTQYIYQSVPTYSYQSYPDYYQYPTSYSYPTTYYQQPTQIYAYQTPSYPYYTNNQYTVTGQSNNSNELNISCSAEPSASAVGQPVTWTATVTGGAAPYTYSWSGSDGISGSQGSVTKYYDSAGEKTAIVMVTSANGLTSTHPCDNTLTVQGGGQGAYLPQTGAAAPSQTPVENGNPNAAAAALSNVPWGWLASLIILVLLGTMAYLLFERQKVKISP